MGYEDVVKSVHNGLCNGFVPDEEKVEKYRKFIKEGGFKFYEGLIEWVCKHAGTDTWEEGVVKYGEKFPSTWSDIYFCRQLFDYYYGCEGGCCPCMWGGPTAEIEVLLPKRQDSENDKNDPVLCSPSCTCNFCHALSASSVCRGFDDKAFLENYKDVYMSDEFRRQYNEALPKIHKIIDGYREGLDNGKVN